MLRTLVLTALAAPLLALAFISCGDGGGSGDGATPTTSATAPAATSTEAPADFTPSPADIPDVDPATNISLPDGFSAYAIATGFFRPTSIALADDGTLFVSERHGTIYRLLDSGDDGVYETLDPFASGFQETTGLLAHDGLLYISSTGRVTTARDTDGNGQADETVDVIDGLPHGRHQNNGLVIGPDGMLYLTNGTTCDDCDEADERSGTILQANAGGSQLRVFAGGLRNPYDIVFDAAGRLWATDNGSDEPCETFDELNLIIAGGDYGWPYGEDGCDPLSDGLLPAAGLGLHTASTGIDYYDAPHFPPSYRGGLFMTLWGSFFTEPELPPQLLHGAIDEGSGAPRVNIATFAEGFAHPIDVVVDRDGTLLVLDYGVGGEDDTSGTLYRIVYTRS